MNELDKSLLNINRFVNEEELKNKYLREHGDKVRVGLFYLGYAIMEDKEMKEEVGDGKKA